MRFSRFGCLGRGFIFEEFQKVSISSPKYVFDLFMHWLILVILCEIIFKLTKNFEKTPVYPLLGISGLWVNFN